jgi:hypothetical protein
VAATPRRASKRRVAQNMPAKRMEGFRVKIMATVQGPVWHGLLPVRRRGREVAFRCEVVTGELSQLLTKERNRD